MKILIINYYYPPTVDAHAYRWEEIAKFWVGAGHAVDVITSRVQGISNSSMEFGVSVRRVGLFAKPVPSAAEGHGRNSLVSKARRRFLSTMRWFYRKIYWPDAMWHWIPSVICEVMRKRRINYDVVVSYYPCMAAHLAAAVLKYTAKNPRFVWIADYGDPFSTSATMPPNNYLLYDKLNRITEVRLGAYADYMAFTNEAMADAYKKKLGLDDEIKVVPHLVNVDRYYAGKSPMPSDPEVTVLTFVGGFHRNIREPKRLFDLVRELNRIDPGKYFLKIYGPLNGFEISELAPADCSEIIYMGLVERKRAVELMQNADVIVNVDNENCSMTPSKIVECISTGRPIINITNDNVFYLPLHRYADIGYAISVIEKQISDVSAVAVRNFIKMHQVKKIASLEDVRDSLKNHTLEMVADRYLALGGRDV